MNTAFRSPRDQPPHPRLLPSQATKLRTLYDEYWIHAEDDAALVKLVRTVDPTLIDHSVIFERLESVGYKHRNSPILTYEQLEELALTTPAFTEPPLPKDERETVDAFVQLGGQPDRGGFISSDTMRDTLNNYKLLLDVQAVMNEVDTDGSGTIEYDEFEAFYRRSSIHPNAAGFPLRSRLVSFSERSLTSNAAQQLITELLLNGEINNDDEVWHDYAGSFASFGSTSDNEYVLEDHDGGAATTASGQYQREEASPPPIFTTSPPSPLTRQQQEQQGGNDDEGVPSQRHPTPLDGLEASFGATQQGGTPLDNESMMSGSPFILSRGATTSFSPQQSARGASPAGTHRTGRPRAATQANMLARKLRQVLQVHTNRLQDVNVKFAKVDTDGDANIPTMAAEYGPRRATSPAKEEAGGSIPIFLRHTRNSIQRQPITIQQSHPAPSRRPSAASLPPNPSRPQSARSGVHSRPQSAKSGPPSRPLSARSLGPRHASDMKEVSSGIQQATDTNRHQLHREYTLEELLNSASRKVETLRGELGTSRPPSASKSKGDSNNSKLGGVDPRYEDDGFIQEDTTSECELARPLPSGHNSALKSRGLNPHRPTSARAHGERGGSRAVPHRPLTAPSSQRAKRRDSTPIRSGKEDAPVVVRPFTASQHRPRTLQVEPAVESALFRGRDFYSYFASTAPKSAYRSSAANLRQ